MSSTFRANGPTSARDSRKGEELNTSASSENTIRPLYIHPPKQDLSGVKAAVVEMALPFKVRPFDFDPGHAGRVLVLCGDFPWIHDHVAPRNPANLKKAIGWCLGIEELERGPVSILSQLRSILGDVTEITEALANGEIEEAGSWA